MTTHTEKRARHRWSADEKRTMVQKWQASGLSARKFGVREGISAANLLRWRDAHATAERPQRSRRATVKFAPVRVAKVETERAADDASSRAVLELVLHGGARVRVLEGADVRMVSELVLAVARGA
jgi:transposase-like protein